MEVLQKVFRFMALWGILFALWMLYTLDFHPGSLSLGLVFSAATSLFTFTIFFGEPGTQSRIVYRFDLVLWYLVLLIIQNYIASFTLIHQMLTGSYSSGVVRVKTRLKSRIGKTLLANTISLVPGTLSLWLEGNYIYVHWFDQKTSHRLKAGRIIKEPMEGIIMRIFG